MDETSNADGAAAVIEKLPITCRHCGKSASSQATDTNFRKGLCRPCNRQPGVRQAYRLQSKFGQWADRTIETGPEPENEADDLIEASADRAARRLPLFDGPRDDT